MSKPVTRREFLNLIAATGGVATVLGVGGALGLIPASTQASVPNLMPLNGQRRRVVVLGGGISGLTTAYELGKVGYDCTVLESSHRCGGRIMTVRHGDLIDEIGNPQICKFDDEPHLYFNCGAARLPSSHKNTLNYCKELGVELEMFINENKHALVHDPDLNGGKPMRNIDVSTNLKGFMAELMFKGFNNAELDQPFTDDEAAKLLAVIRQFGDLDEDGRYSGSLRNGYASGGFISDPVQKEMIHVRDLLKANTGLLRSVLLENEGETAPMLMQPIGGMDNIIKGFLRKLEGKVEYHAMVMAVHDHGDQIDVTYDQNGQRLTITADYVFNCIPSHLMVGIENNFPEEYRSAMKSIRRGEAFKGAFQMKQRFWENEEIYGGITWTNQPIRQIWYPFHGLLKQKGVMLAAYDYGGGSGFMRMTHDERIEAMLSQGEKIHPQYREMAEHGITIAWHRMNHMLGCSARWGARTPENERNYQILQQPAGRHYMIGDQISRKSAWMESAIQSAHWAMAHMDQRVRAEAGA
ncbi:flavin monoamine oxidase family protein [Pseudohongiella spirulinae]|uniref:Amine oxidase n=1 Tax=Pseudohongiella spirulinae TaxID=1249552 RepID=A0A0S2KCD3_9GAMM|nr:FAD-dependent oxidoreductase [Pseudohongiella spirulinae]ALO45990.1 Amine oxidase [Pseudohongiella spirulinae]